MNAEQHTCNIEKGIGGIREIRIKCIIINYYSRWDESSILLLLLLLLLSRECMTRMGSHTGCTVCLHDS